MNRDGKSGNKASADVHPSPPIAPFLATVILKQPGSCQQSHDRQCEDAGRQIASNPPPQADMQRQQTPNDDQCRRRDAM